MSFPKWTDIQRTRVVCIGDVAADSEVVQKLPSSAVEQEEIDRREAQPSNDGCD